MSRLSIRPRPLDIHKKLPIVKSFKDFEDEDLPTTSATRSSQLLRIAESDIILNHSNHEVNPAPAKKFAAEIPTPQFVVVDTYERDYSRTFGQPTSYLRGRGARAELGEFVEYDLDNEDEDWLEEFNEEKKILSPERLESILFKLEVLDHKARERAGLLTPTFGAPIPVYLQPDAAFEALQVQGIKYSLFQSVYYFWKDKRERWQKPILRRLQPPPPVNDTNPYNVFRPREKAHRQHTRRMQRRENNVQSFEKLRQVRRNLEQAKVILEALIKREERKREVMETEVTLQRFHLKYKHEIELLDDNLGVAALSSKFGSSEEDFMDSDDVANVHPVPRLRGAAAPHTPQVHHGYTDSSNMVMIPTAAAGAAAASVKQEFRRRHMAPPNHRWLQRMDPLEPILLFTKPLVPEKLGAAGIVAPSDMAAKSGGSVSSSHPPKFRGRMGRGGRIIFDRWNPLSQSPLYVLPPKPQASSMYD